MMERVSPMEQPTGPKDLDPLLTPMETARRLNLSLSWLAKSRKKGTGPHYMKTGGVVRYPTSAVQRFIRDHMK